jgi:uncharacterized lipoprotein YmbA
MKSCRTSLTLLALLITLTACGTTPKNNYYLLTATDAAAPRGHTPSLGIGPIEIPEYLNRNRLVYNRDGNQLRIANYERWAEPLANGVARVVSLNLAHLLNTENVQGFPWPRSQEPDYSVQITIMSLDAGNNHAKLVAEWMVLKPGKAPVSGRKISQILVQIPGDSVTPQQIAPAYSDLLYQLSEIIAAKITADGLGVLP